MDSIDMVWMELNPTLTILGILPIFYDPSRTLDQQTLAQIGVESRR